MPSFKQEIEKEIAGAAIEMCVIGEMMGGWEENGNKTGGKVLSWEEASPLLSYEYNGGACHAIYVYTKERIFFVQQYDAQTCLRSIPRNPTDELPIMPGV